MRLNLTKLRLDVEETGPRAIRVERARDAQTKVAFETAAEQERLDGLEMIRDDNATGRLTMGQASLQFVLLALGLGLVAVDAVVQFVVNSFNVTAVSTGTWLVASPFIALALGGITHGTAHALTYDPTRPQRSVRQCLKYAGVFGTACVAALAVFLFSRTASEDLVPYLVTAVSTSLWVLAEALPVTGGLLSAAAHHMAYPALHARRIQRVKERLAELTTLALWLEQEQQRLEPLPRDDAESGTGGASAPPVSTGPPGSTPVPAARPLAAAALLLSLFSPTWTGCIRTTDAPSTTPAVETLASAVVPPFPAAPVSGAAGNAAATRAEGRPLTIVRDTTCSIYVDDTESVDPIGRERAVQALLDGLPAFLDAFACRELRLGHFSDEGAFAPVQALLVPAPISEVCSDAKPSAATDQFAALAFDQFRSYYAKERKAACERRQQVAAAAIEAQLQSFFRTARATLAAPPATFGAKCTAIWPVVEHVVADRNKRLLVLVTDAADTCNRPPPLIETSPNVRVLLVLIPSVGPIAERGPEALARGAAWRSRIRGLTVVLFHELPDWRWADLMSGANEQ